MAKFRAWVGTPGGGGIALRTDGTIEKFDRKPPEIEFLEKPEDAPKGDFIKLPSTDFTFDEQGRAIPIPGSQYAANLAAPGGQVRTEFIGELEDRRRKHEQVMAAKLGARMGAKQKLDSQGLRMGYTPVQERQRSALLDVRAKLEAGYADDQYTPTQMQQFEEMVTLKENAILPQMIRQPLSSQEKLQASIVRLDNGRVGQLDKDGIFKEIQDGFTFKDWNTAIENATGSLKEEALVKDAKGVITAEGKPPTTDEIQERAKATLQSYFAAKGFITGATGGQPAVPGVEPGVQGVRPTMREPIKKGRKVKAEVALGKREKAVVDRYRKNDNINWKFIEDSYGKETADELRDIIKSGNEQALVAALRELEII